MGRGSYHSKTCLQNCFAESGCQLAGKMKLDSQIVFLTLWEETSCSGNLVTSLKGILGGILKSTYLIAEQNGDKLKSPAYS